MAQSPAWRRAFDGVEHRVTPPLKSVTGSPDFQIVISRLRRVRRAVVRPVDGVISWGLHLAGLPSHADVRNLRRQLGTLQGEVLTLRRELVEGEHERDEPR